MKEAYDRASKEAAKAAAYNKKYHDKRVYSTNLQPGDRVLVRNLTPRGGPGKLRAFWEDDIHTVIRQVGDNPVFEVQSESLKNSKKRVLHQKSPYAMRQFAYRHFFQSN